MVGPGPKGKGGRGGRRIAGGGLQWCAPLPPVEGEGRVRVVEQVSGGSEHMYNIDDLGASPSPRPLPRLGERGR
jgi:hypothetical protein